MIKLIINFIKKFCKTVLFFFLFLVFLIFIFFFFFQFEIILYFFPDVLIDNLNELWKTDIFLTFSNSFNLLKGYIFVDSDFYYKTAMLSSSYGLIQYRKYKRNLRILRTNRIRKKRKKLIYMVPLNNKVKKYAKPLFIRYLYHLSNRNVYYRLLLLSDLLEMSSFTQKLWLFYWEFTERSNINVQKRKMYQRLVALRTTLHSFPIYDRTRIIFKTMYYLDQDGIRYNTLKNYNFYNIYKKFAKYIYNGFFTDTIEPYRSYNLYLLKKKDVGVIPKAYLFNYWIYDDGFRYRTHHKYKETYELYSNRVAQYQDYFDYLGFGKKIPSYYSHNRFHRRRYRFRFSRFYTEKFLLKNSANNFRKVQILNTDPHWKFQLVKKHKGFGEYFSVKHVANRETYGDIKLMLAYDLKSRAGYWKKYFSRYDYRAKDYIYKNFDFFFFFKKYYLHIMDDLFVFPKFQKTINIFNTFLTNYFKLNNYFITFLKKKDSYVNYKDNLIKKTNYNNFNKYFNHFNKDSMKIFLFNDWFFIFLFFLNLFL